MSKKTVETSVLLTGDSTAATRKLHLRDMPSGVELLTISCDVGALLCGMVRREDIPAESHGLPDIFGKFGNPVMRVTALPDAQGTALSLCWQAKPAIGTLRVEESSDYYAVGCALFASVYHRVVLKARVPRVDPRIGLESENQGRLQVPHRLSTTRIVERIENGPKLMKAGRLTLSIQSNAYSYQWREVRWTAWPVQVCKRGTLEIRTL